MRGTQPTENCWIFKGLGEEGFPSCVPAAKKAENHRKGLDSTEEPFDPAKDQPDPKWWEKRYEGLGGYRDQYEWNWWNKRGKVIDMNNLV